MDRFRVAAEETMVLDEAQDIPMRWAMDAMGYGIQRERKLARW